MAVHFGQQLLTIAAGRRLITPVANAHIGIKDRHTG
jgi:hypothetical protein